MCYVNEGLRGQSISGCDSEPDQHNEFRILVSLASPFTVTNDVFTTQHWQLII